MARASALIALPLVAALGTGPAAGEEAEERYGPSAPPPQHGTRSHHDPGAWMAWMAPRPRIGVSVQPMSPQLREYFGVDPERGVLVESVEAESPAARAALRAGDVILEANGEPVRRPGDLARAVLESEGEAVVLEISRKGSPERVEVVPEPPARPPHELAWEALRPWAGGGLRELREQIQDLDRRLHELEQRIAKDEPDDRT